MRFGLRIFILKKQELKAKQEALTTVFDPQPEQKSEKNPFSNDFSKQ